MAQPSAAQSNKLVVAVWPADVRPILHFAEGAHAMTPVPSRRWSFSLRTLFVVVTATVDLPAWIAQVVVFTTLCHAHACGGDEPTAPNIDTPARSTSPVNTSKRNTNSDRTGDQSPPSRAAQMPVRDVESLAALLQPRLPRGWTLTRQDERVVIQRVEPVEVFNALALPDFSSDAERRAYVQKNVIRRQFTMVLWLGDRLDPAAVKSAEQRNLRALGQARKNRGDGKFMPDDNFWKAHPEYGYRKLPTFDSGTRGIFVHVDPYGVPWEFWVGEVEAECRGIFDDLEKLFTPVRPLSRRGLSRSDH